MLQEQARKGRLPEIVNKMKLEMWDPNVDVIRNARARGMLSFVTCGPGAPFLGNHHEHRLKLILRHLPPGLPGSFFVHNFIILLREGDEKIILGLLG
jgi:hypothetical protein